MQFDSGVHLRQLESRNVSIMYPSGQTHMLEVRIAGGVQDKQIEILSGLQVRQLDAGVH